MLAKFFLVLSLLAVAIPFCLQSIIRTATLLFLTADRLQPPLTFSTTEFQTAFSMVWALFLQSRYSQFSGKTAKKILLFFKFSKKKLRQTSKLFVDQQLLSFVGQFWTGGIYVLPLKRLFIQQFFILFSVHSVPCIQCGQAPCQWFP